MRRNLEFIKVNLFIVWKRILEYKVTSYSAFLLEGIYFLTMLLFVSILLSDVLSITSWTKADYMFYLILAAIVNAFSGTIIWREELGNVIVKGDLNSYLTKPFGTLFFFTFYMLPTSAFVFLVVDILILVGFLVFVPFEMVNVFLFLLLFFLLCLFFVFMTLFLFSLDLFKIGLSDIFLSNIMRINYLFENYPAFFFEKVPFKQLLLFFPFFFIGSLLLPLLRGYEIWNFELQIMVLVGLTVVFMIGTFVFWHYGLKKYEAFG